MKRPVYPSLHLPWAVFLLLLSSFSPTQAQVCGDIESTAEVTLNDIGTVYVTGASGKTEAADIYLKALASAAESNGLAACQSSCTLGECQMTFVEYIKGKTPLPRLVNDVYVFPPPRGDSLSYVVNCPCVLDVYIDPDTLDGRPYQGGIGAVVETPVQGTELAGTAVQFFPNPARDEVFVDLYLATAQPASHLRIIDLRGSVVQHRDLGKLERGSHRFKVDVSGLAPGIYFALIDGARVNPAQTRLLIQR